MWVQFPHNVLLAAPKRINLYLLDVVSELLHSRQIFNYVANIQLISEKHCIMPSFFLKQMLKQSRADNFLKLSFFILN